MSPRETPSEVLGFWCLILEMLRFDNIVVSCIPSYELVTVLPGTLLERINALCPPLETNGLPSYESLHPSLMGNYFDAPLDYTDPITDRESMLHRRSWNHSFDDPDTLTWYKTVFKPGFHPSNPDYLDECLRGLWWSLNTPCFNRMKEVGSGAPMTLSEKIGGFTYWHVRKLEPGEIRCRPPGREVPVSFKLVKGGTVKSEPRWV
jgi:hypothetical protein